MSFRGTKDIKENKRKEKLKRKQDIKMYKGIYIFNCLFLTSHL